MAIRSYKVYSTPETTSCKDPGWYKILSAVVRNELVFKKSIKGLLCSRHGILLRPWLVQIFVNIS